MDWFNNLDLFGSTKLKAGAVAFVSVVTMVSVVTLQSSSSTSTPSFGISAKPPSLTAPTNTTGDDPRPLPPTSSNGTDIPTTFDPDLPPWNTTVPPNETAITFPPEWTLFPSTTTTYIVPTPTTTTFEFRPPIPSTTPLNASSPNTTSDDTITRPPTLFNDSIWEAKSFVRVCDTSVFAIPICRGLGCYGSGQFPPGTECPRLGDVALANCTGPFCVAPEDARCQRVKTNTWGCVFPSIGCPRKSG
ncbi:Aste57867_24618 [Aphanomyces stellatus]|uniref:Aste57867_24618 protein n=1 Tax=Aphanomyces stellatus TaxID=120398 RepID=A0A485LQX8_9STRA|nr:hypothetical protein As57867_024540 [Aphanomyces stellatus]VFU01255.1 Aste57867_24618 [Aphanomyces stellatus]